MKVKFLIHGSGAGYGYFAGAVANLPTNEAARLIEMGVCASQEDDSNNCELPEGIPYREDLEKAGVNSIDELEKITDLTVLPGIGKGKSKAINKYLGRE